MKKLIAVPVLLAVLCVLALSGAASANPLNITNVQKSFDPLNCEVTITWDTNKSTDADVVRWDNTSCALNPTWPHEETATHGTSHTVTFSVADATGTKIAFMIESTWGVHVATTACAATMSGPCIAQ